MENTKILDLDNLPLDILRQIPLSIRVAKSTYRLSELPKYIQLMVKNYVNKDEKNLEKNNVIGVKPEISSYGDFETITNKKDLIKEILRNYLSTYNYPFDVEFGCKLKTHMQMKDTVLRQNYVTNEVNKVVDVVSQELMLKISSKDINIEKTENASGQVFYYT